MKIIKKIYYIICAVLRRRRGRTLFVAILISTGVLFYKNIAAGSILETLPVMVETFASNIKSEVEGFSSDDTITDSAIETAVITKILDGDTITVEMNGESAKVRLLEVDTPESVHPDENKNTDFGKEASEYMKSNLQIGQTVYLTKDSSDMDRYGRLLRLVWIDIPMDYFDETELRQKCFNARLLLDGYAEVEIVNDKAYQEVFDKFQRDAMSHRRGLWADDSWWEFVGLE